VNLTHACAPSSARTLTGMLSSVSTMDKISASIARACLEGQRRGPTSASRQMAGTRRRPQQRGNCGAGVRGGAPCPAFQRAPAAARRPLDTYPNHGSWNRCFLTTGKIITCPLAKFIRVTLVRDERTHPHRPRLVVFHSTCRPLSSSPPREQLCNRSCSNKHTHMLPEPLQNHP